MSTREEDVLNDDGAPPPKVDGDEDLIDTPNDEGDERLVDQALDGDEEETPPPKKRAVTPADRTKERRERRLRAEKALRDENAYFRGLTAQLASRITEVEGRALSAEAMGIDTRLAECLNEAATAERIYAAAIKASNGEDAMAAQKIRDEALTKARQLEAERKKVAHDRANPKPIPSVPPPGAAESTAHGVAFGKDKPWLRFNGPNQPANQESAATMIIDQQLAREGKLRPDDARYWQELDKRVKAAMPHLFNGREDADEEDHDDEDEVDSTPTPPRKKGPTVGGSGKQGGTGEGFKLSAARIDAIREAGHWDDPKLRAKAIAAYKLWDKNNLRR